MATESRELEKLEQGLLTQVAFMVGPCDEDPNCLCHVEAARNIITFIRQHDAAQQHR